MIWIMFPECLDHHSLGIVCSNLVQWRWHSHTNNAHVHWWRVWRLWIFERQKSLCYIDKDFRCSATFLSGTNSDCFCVSKRIIIPCIICKLNYRRRLKNMVLKLVKNWFTARRLNCFRWRFNYRNSAEIVLYIKKP